MSKTLSKAEILSKFGKAFASTSESRPALQGIHYGVDGSAFVTNAHYALRVSDVHSFQQPMTLHAKTGQPIDGVYPDFSRSIPIDFHEEIKLFQESIPEALLASQCVSLVASKINKKMPVARMVIQDGNVCLCTDSLSPHLDLSVKVGAAPNRSRSRRSFNAEYFSTALAVFEAANTAVTLKLRGPHDPIVLSGENGIDVLILPYRVSA